MEHVLLFALVAAAVSGVHSIQVTSSVSPQTPVLGENVFRLECKFILTASPVEQLQGLFLQRKRISDEDFQDILVFNPPSINIAPTYIDTSLETRTVATWPDTSLSTSATLTFNDTLCSDIADYKWVYTYFQSGLGTVQDASTTVINVKATGTFSGQSDYGITFSPASYDVTEGENIEFTCKADIGRVPQGNLAWYYYKAGSPIPVAISDQASNDGPEVARTCSLSQRSVLVMTMTQALDKYLVRCTLQQDDLTPEGDTHRQTEKFNVKYVRVKRALPPTKSLVHNVAIEVGCDVHPIVKLEFRESDVSPSNTEVKQRKIVEFISPGLSENDEASCDSPKSFKYDSEENNSFRSPAQFSPSEASAFSKIGKPETDTAIPANGPPKGFYQHPGLIPTSFFPYALAALRPEHCGGSLSNSAGDRFLYPPSSLSSTNSEKSPSSSPDKNMYYYVDPRIPFTNYFLNLTRLLNNTNSANKSCSATTPLAKVSEESRADERDHTVSPDSQTLSPRQFSAGEISASKYSAISPMEIDRKDLKPLEKLHIPAYPDPHLPNPYTSLLHTAAQSSMLPLHSGGIFHPAMMQIPGPGFRRFNPEKPPPVKKYKCDVCGKAFSRSNTLVTHKRIHTGDKPFKCEICSRAFRQPGNLTRHRLTHTTVKPYVCPTCHKAFNRASNLHTHMRTHTSFKAFVCPFCGKGFHQKIDMKIHCYTHTGRGEAPPM